MLVSIYKEKKTNISTYVDESSVKNNTIDFSVFGNSQSSLIVYRSQIFAQRFTDKTNEEVKLLLQKPHCD